MPGTPILGVFVHLHEALQRHQIGTRILEGGRYVVRVASVGGAECFGHAVAQKKFELSDGLETGIAQPRVAFVEPDYVVISSARNEGLAGKVCLPTTEEIDAETFIANRLDLPRSYVWPGDDETPRPQMGYPLCRGRMRFGVWYQCHKKRRATLLHFPKESCGGP